MAPVMLNAPPIEKASNNRGILMLDNMAYSIPDLFSNIVGKLASGIFISPASNDHNEAAATSISSSTAKPIHMKCFLLIMDTLSGS